MPLNTLPGVALRIPCDGEFGDTQVSTGESIRTLLRNGFTRTLAEGLAGHPRPKGDPEKTRPPPAADPP